MIFNKDKKKKLKTIITCLHAGNRIPWRHLRLLLPHLWLLKTHQGYDPGALELAKFLSRRLKCRLDYNTITRLLVEFDASPRNREFFSTLSKNISPQDKKRLLNNYHKFYHKLERVISQKIKKEGRVLHLVVHTFTPVFGGRLRQVDIGLLYNPQRKAEKNFCQHWQKIINRLAPQLKLKLNYPYAGTEDGATTIFRRRFPAKNYLGIEIEVNQKFSFGEKKEWKKIEEIISKSLKVLLKN